MRALTCGDLYLVPDRLVTHPRLRQQQRFIPAHREQRKSAGRERHPCPAFAPVGEAQRAGERAALAGLALRRQPRGMNSGEGDRALMQEGDLLLAVGVQVDRHRHTIEFEVAQFLLRCDAATRHHDFLGRHHSRGRRRRWRGSHAISHLVILPVITRFGPTTQVKRWGVRRASERVIIRCAVESSRNRQQARVGKGDAVAVGDRQPGEQVERLPVRRDSGDIVGCPIEPGGEIGERDIGLRRPVALCIDRQGGGDGQVGRHAVMDQRFGQARTAQRLHPVRAFDDERLVGRGADDRVLLYHSAGRGIGAAQMHRLAQRAERQIGGRQQPGVAIFLDDAAGQSSHRRADRDHAVGHPLEANGRIAGW